MAKEEVLEVVEEPTNTEETEDTSGGYSFEPSPEEVLEDLMVAF